MAIVRGRIVGGTSAMFIIAVDAAEKWGRVFRFDGRTLGPLMPVESIVKFAPHLAEAFDGTEDDADAILDAAHAPDLIYPAEVEYDLPPDDIVERET